MGYTTDFSGGFRITPRLSKKKVEYINLFSETRRMKRDVSVLMKLYNGKYGLPTATEKTAEAIYGKDGEYFARDDGDSGQREDASIIDYNTPPGQMSHDRTTDFTVVWEENEKRRDEGVCQPGLWCQWQIFEQGDQMFLEWDGGEKFYAYVEWLVYLINHFFVPWKVKLNGEVVWQGEEIDDRGKIIIKNNVIKIQKVTYTDIE